MSDIEIKKLSIPIVANIIDEDKTDEWAEAFYAAHADRVFIFFPADFLSDEAELQKQINVFKIMKTKLNAKGIEVGAWLNAFTSFNNANKGNFVHLQGVYKKSKNDFCPLDTKFQKAYYDYVKKIAAASPTLIMLDDDYRLGVRSYSIGCFCKLHRKAFAKEYGRDLSTLSIANKVFNKKVNKARTAFLKVCGDSLINFAKGIRLAVNEVDSSIRVGCCMCLDSLSLCGTNTKDLAYALAGDTKPFCRTSGAPYWQVMAKWGDSRAVAEYTRSQVAVLLNSGIEVFSEGDVFPRPRYNVPGAVLECFDAYLYANGNCGILKYIFDYNYPLGYETGYLKYHLKNYDIIRKIGEIFENKAQTGINFYQFENLISEYDLSVKTPPMAYYFGAPSKNKAANFFTSLISRPTNFVASTINKVCNTLTTISFPKAQRLFSANGLPTTYIDDNENIIVCFGENARHIPEDKLTRGLIIDAVAAKILTERGYDVGFVSSKTVFATGECFEFGKDTEIKLNTYLVSLNCSSSAEIVSTYLPDNSVASYLYTNNLGQRFYVLGILSDAIPASGDNAYFLNYYRQNNLHNIVTKLSNNNIVAKVKNQINLTLLASKDNSSVSIGLFNFYIDPALDVKVELSINAKEVNYINCSGKLDGNTLSINEISPYGFCAVEILT